MYGLYSDDDLIKISDTQEKLEDFIKAFIEEHNKKHKCKEHQFLRTDFDIEYIDYLII